MILPAALLTDYLIAREQRHWAAIVLVLYVLICLPVIRFPGVAPAGGSNLLFFSRLAFMTIFAGVTVWLLFAGSTEPLKQQFSMRNSASAVAARSALVALGCIANEKQLRGQFQNYNHRVTNIP